MTLVNSWICFNELMDNVNKKDDLTILDFKRSVTMGLLAKGLNIGKPAGRAGNLEGTVHPSAEFKNKRRKSGLSTRNEMRFANVGEANANARRPRLWWRLACIYIDFFEVLAAGHSWVTTKEFGGGWPT